MNGLLHPTRAAKAKSPQSNPSARGLGSRWTRFFAIREAILWQATCEILSAPHRWRRHDWLPPKNKNASGLLPDFFSYKYLKIKKRAHRIYSQIAFFLFKVMGEIRVAFKKFRRPLWPLLKLMCVYDESHSGSSCLSFMFIVNFKILFCFN